VQDVTIIPHRLTPLVDCVNEITNNKLKIWQFAILICTVSYTDYERFTARKLDSKLSLEFQRFNTERRLTITSRTTVAINSQVAPVTIRIYFLYYFYIIIVIITLGVQATEATFKWNGKQQSSLIAQTAHTLWQHKFAALGTCKGGYRREETSHLCESMGLKLIGSIWQKQFGGGLNLQAMCYINQKKERFQSSRTPCGNHGTEERFSVRQTKLATC